MDELNCPYLPNELWQIILLFTSCKDISNFALANPECETIVLSSIEYFANTLNIRIPKGGTLLEKVKAFGEGHLSGIKQIVCGANHSMLTTKDSVYACGSNSNGQLGLGDKHERHTFTRIPNTPSNINQLYGGDFHTLLLTDDDTVYACGYNSRGQLGLGDNNERHIFTLVPNTPSNITQIQCGYFHTLLLTDENKLYACGGNHEGQLGLGDRVNRNTFTLIPNTPSNIKQLYGGDFHTMLLTDENKVYACGENSYGQLGLGDNNEINTFTRIPNTPSNVTQLCCSFNHTLLLTDDDTVYACGDNSYGQLGLGDNNKRHTFTRIPNTPRNITHIVCGYAHSMLLTDDDTVYVCGYNYHGQLGLGDEVEKNTFALIPNTPSNIKQIRSGNYYSMVLTDDDTVYACGNNSYGQLGLGDNNERNTFTQVSVKA